jgi:hypothetical protein
MKHTLYSFFLTLALFFAINTEAYSQFEGEIKFQVEDYTSSNPEQAGFTFTATHNRLFLSSEQDIDVIAGLRANGLLVRNDHKDFIFNTDADEALKVSKDDLDSLMNLIERFSGASKNGEPEKFDWQTGVEETGNTRSHLGYDLHEFRLKGENDQQFASIWLTDQIKVRWGLMVDVWNTAGPRFSESELPIELIMNPHSFPLLVEVFDNGQLVYKAESTHINTDTFDRSDLDLSDDKKLLGLTELMMNMFRQRR